ncbi:hypothetical protein IFM89_027837 [Coptis chinensis]|uniref:Endonuclease/exonuclease/phosphatase domain-containing protein n=1 Tax=Coptis chinensis TaxID=261450 RepID=A0A835LP15_9MAGN|nr:hypothetical protein IFM89_027837 [Coptis chinensis]
MIHDRETVNELVESFFEADRESRRKTPIHDEGRWRLNMLPNILAQNSLWERQKLQSVKVLGGRSGPKDSMSLLAWNSRGSGRPSMMEELKKQIRVARPFFMFVMETKCSVDKGVRLIKRLGDFESFVVPSCGLSGGLWIFWEKSVVVDVLMYDSWFIHCKIAVQVNGVKECFFLCCVYGNAKSCVRRLQWPVLTMFKPNNNESWLLMGDFNEITCPEEKCGGKPFNYPKVRFFLDMIDDCESLDLGFVGSIYTDK